MNIVQHVQCLERTHDEANEARKSRMTPMISTYIAVPMFQGWHSVKYVNVFVPPVHCRPQLDGVAFGQVSPSDL